MCLGWGIGRPKRPLKAGGHFFVSENGVVRGRQCIIKGDMGGTAVAVVYDGGFGEVF